MAATILGVEDDYDRRDSLTGLLREERCDAEQRDRGPGASLRTPVTIAGLLAALEL